MSNYAFCSLLCIDSYLCRKLRIQVVLRIDIEKLDTLVHSIFIGKYAMYSRSNLKKVYNLNSRNIKQKIV